MKYGRRFLIGLSTVVLLIASKAAAIPMVSVDTDPSTAGVQSSLSILLGNPFSVDVGITGVEAGQPLNAYEFDLVFDPFILGATSVTSGGFLPAPAFVIESDTTSPDVNFAEFALVLSAVGDGVLASVSFNTLGLGTSSLDLTNVILASSIPPGTQIPATLSDGSVTVTSLQPIPEPSTVLLLGAGIVGLMGARWRRFRTA